MAVTVAEFFNKVGFKVDQNSVNKVNGTIKGIKSTATKLLGAIGIGLSLSAINGLVEEFGAANKQIKAVVGEVENLTDVQDQVLAKANEARLVYGDLAGYISNLTKAGDIFPIEDAMQFTSTVAKLMKTNGRNDSQISSMMEGFNKSFQKGIVDTETLNKMLEQAPETANVLAQSLGVAKSQLLDMASKGTMTVQQLKDAFMDASGEIDAAFANSNMSISDGLKSIRNKWGLWLAQMNSTLGVTNTIARAMVRFSDIALSGMNKIRNAVVWLGDKLGGTDKALKLLTISVAAFLVATKSGQVITFLKTVGTAISKIKIQVLGVMAVIILAALLVEDFINFLQGNDSFIGEMLKSAGVDIDRVRATIQKAFDTIKNIVLTVWGTVVSFLAEHGEQLREMFARIWDAITQILRVAFALIAVLAKVVFARLQAFWDKWGEKIKTTFSTVAAFLGRTFERVISVITQLAEVISAIFAGDIGGALKSLLGIFLTIFEQLLDIVKTIFTVIWTFIGDKVSAIKDSIVSGFTAAWEGVKKVFSKVGAFFAGVWNTIVSLFTTIGTAVGDAISGAVKGAINAVLSGAIAIINGFISAINFAIGIINKIPGVNINKLDKLDVPQLAQGGYVRPNSPQAVIIGDNKREGEIVSPISKMRDTFLSAMQMFAATAKPKPATVAAASGGNNVSKSVVQNVEINNKFEGDRAGQQKSATAMKKAEGDITKELARGLAYAR